METAVATTNDLRQVSTFGEYTIAKDFEVYTVHISKPSPRSRLGIKVVVYYSFRTTDVSKSVLRMNKFVDDFIAGKEKEQAAEAARKNSIAEARKNFVCPFQVGQIFYESGGYDQTNLYFYQITAIKGKKVTLRQVAQDRTYSTGMSGHGTALKDEFVGDEFDRMIQIRQWRGSNKVDISLRGLYEWDGTPKYWSSYA